MDPTACLAAIRGLIDDYVSGDLVADPFADSDAHDALMLLVDAVSELDAWMTKAGFAPTQWRNR